MTKKKELTEERANPLSISGFGDNVVKIKDEHGQDLCFIGRINGEDMVHFGKPVSPEAVVAVAELLERKKLRKAINKEDYEKAQRIADKKFSL